MWLKYLNILIREGNVYSLGLVRIKVEYFVISKGYKLLITAAMANTKSDSSGLTDCGPIDKKVINLVQRYLDGPTLRIINNYTTSMCGFSSIFLLWQNIAICLFF